MAMVTLRHTAPHGLQALETWCLVSLDDVAPDVERWLSEEVLSLVPGGRIEVGVVDELAHLDEWGGCGCMTVDAERAA